MLLVLLMSGLIYLRHINVSLHFFPEGVQKCFKNMKGSQEYWLLSFRHICVLCVLVILKNFLELWKKLKFYRKLKKNQETQTKKAQTNNQIIIIKKPNHHPPPPQNFPQNPKTLLLIYIGNQTFAKCLLICLHCICWVMFLKTHW